MISYTNFIYTNLSLSSYDRIIRDNRLTSRLDNLGWIHWTQIFYNDAKIGHQTSIFLEFVNVSLSMRRNCHDSIFSSKSGIIVEFQQRSEISTNFDFLVTYFNDFMRINRLFLILGRICDIISQSVIAFPTKM